MNVLGFVMIKLFFAIECVSCFGVMLLGIGMIEHANTMVALAGSLMATIGVIGFVWFGVLFAREEI
jgi:hypothetical protein